MSPVTDEKLVRINQLRATKRLPPLTMERARREAAVRPDLRDDTALYLTAYLAMVAVDSLGSAEAAPTYTGGGGSSGGGGASHDYSSSSASYDSSSSASSSSSSDSSGSSSSD